MPSRGKDYGNASQVKTHVDSYADGGPVKKKKKMKPHVPPRIKDPIKKGSPGGPHTPGAKAARKKAEAEAARKKAAAEI